MTDERIRRDAAEPSLRVAERYDGRAKVTGQARFAAEFRLPNIVYAYLVQSTVASGEILSIRAVAAERADGVCAVLTPFNAPRLPSSSQQRTPGRALSLLQDTAVHYSGQPVAVVVADRLEQARCAAGLLRVEYETRSALLDFHGRLGEARPPRRAGREPADASRGDLAAAMLHAHVVVDETYTTPIQNHNSMEPHATVAWWEGDKLHLWDSTQSITRDQQAVASAFGIPVENVRVQCPYTGGGFGSKGSTWSHVILAAMAAKVVGRPVKLALERNQMFGPVGSRPATVQRIRLGAAADGRLLAVQHDAIVHASVMEDFFEGAALQTRMLYASEANVTTHRFVDMNLGVCTDMRAPGEASGMSALESAMDELAVKLAIDPVELRLLNCAERDDGRNLPFTSKHLRECYRVAAERFGWAKYQAKPGQRLEGNEFVGWGMATSTRHALRSAAKATVSILPSGRVTVASGTQDLGTGTYTIMASTAGEILGVDHSMIDVNLGDSRLPEAPGSVGSQSAASVCPAVHDAAVRVRLELLKLASEDSQSPLSGMAVDDLQMRDGRVFDKADPSTGETVGQLLGRHGGRSIEGRGTAEPGRERSTHSAYSFGAVFVEVGVDKDTCMVKVRRVVGTYDIGTLINEKTGTNQLVGGIVWGISFALHEQAHIDPVFGRTVNESFAEYHVPVNADVGEIDVSVLNLPDSNFNPLGARGIGEISITGVAAAVANAIYNAAGKRIRDFPITPDKLLRTSPAMPDADRAYAET
jgi:xanthine dehydrogenase YagR molybdenum-binding subunit